MERALKERLVGAVVIVITGVVFIPQLLDGPDEARHSVEPGVALPAASQGVRTVTIPVGRAADEPAPVPSPSASEPVAARPDAGAVRRPPPGGAPSASSSAPEPPASPAPRQAPAQDAAAASGQWAVQVGSFAQADNAGRLRDKLAADGFKAYTSRVVTDAGTMHRVRVGPVAGRADAEQLMQRLARSGQNGRVVRVED